MSKIEYNKKSIGKRVFVTEEGGFYGLIIDVIGDSSFLIKDDKEKLHEINLFNVRYINENENDIK